MGHRVGCRLPVGFLAEKPFHPRHDAFNDDHGTIHDDAEIDGTQTHQVGRHTEEVHHDEGEEQGQGNDRCRDNATTHAAHQQHQHEDDDQRTLYQVLRYRARGAGNQVAAVQKRHYAHVGRQTFLYLLHALLHSSHHLVAVGTLQHQYHAAHGLVTVLCECAVAHLMAEAHVLGHIADEHRHAALVLHHYPLDVVDALHQSLAADETGHVVLLDIGTARVHIVLAQRVKHLLHRHMAGVQLLAAQRYLILLDAAAEGVYLHHAGYHRQLSPHHPVLHRAQLLRRISQRVARL